MADAKSTAPIRDKTAEDIAEIHDVHPKTVKLWARDGCPHSKRGNSYRFNENEVAAWLFQTNRKTTPGRPPEPKSPVPPGLEGDKDYWLARKYRSQCLKDEGQLIPVEEVKRWIGEHITSAKNKMIGLGAAVTPQLEGRDAAERQAIIDSRVNEILDELAAA